MHPAALDPAALLQACSETRTKRSGPGGQHRNKVETAVVLVHRPTGISAEAAERRSQAENRKVALRRLRLKLALEHRTPAPAAGPSARWSSRIRDRRCIIATDHDDYPALIAEALDVLQSQGFHLAPTAAHLGISGSQLTGLFKKVAAAWVAFNRHRLAAGLPALR